MLKRLLALSLLMLAVAVAVGPVVAQDGDTSTVEFRVWQHVDDAGRIHVSARPAGGEWATLGTIRFRLDDGHSADESLRYGQLTVGSVELRVWQDVDAPLSIAVTARHEDGDWFSLGPLALDDGHSTSGRYRYGDLTVVASPTASSAVSFSPGGDEAPRLATVTIAFSVPPTTADAAGLVSIEPSVEGSFVWVDSHTLLFQPAYPGWQRGQRYAMRVGGSAAGLGDYAHTFAVEGALEVAYIIPGDGDREVPAEAQILVQFNRSVAALTVLQEGDAPAVLEFDPPLAGKGEWLNTSLYRFIPSDLQPSAEYEVRIAAGLTSAADGVLASDFTWSFATIQPAVTSFEPGDGTKFVEPDGPFVITFNQPMDRASVEAGVALRPEDGEAVAATFGWSEDDTVVTVTPDQPLALGASYELVAAAGLRGADAGVSASQRMARFTVVESPRLVRTEPADSESEAGTYWIQLYYNNPMDPESFEGRTSVSGIDIEDLWVSVYDNHAYISAPLRHSTGYTVRIAEGVLDRGGRTLPAYEFSFTTRPPAPALSLAVPNSLVTYSANGPQVLYYHAARIEDVRFRLYRLSETEAETLLQRGYLERHWWDEDPFWPDSDPVRDWTEQIGEDLHNASRLYSTALGDVEPLPRGDYLLVAGHEAASQDRPVSLERKLMFSVVDTAIVTKQAHGELLVWAVDHDTGEPLEGVEVRAVRSDDPPRNSYETANTDTAGLARFAVTDWNYRHYDYSPASLVRVDAGGRYGVASTTWTQGASQWELAVPTTSFVPRPKGYVYTDRPIYRPGETVFFKGVLRDEDDASYSIPTTSIEWALTPSREYSVWVRDPEYGTAFHSRLEIGALGTLDGSFQLPADAPTGTYRLAIQPPTTNTNIAATSFTVAEFRTPEFEVDVAADSADYRDGDAITADVQASFFFGGAVADAGVEWVAYASPVAIHVEGYEDYSFSDYDRWTASSRTPLRARGETRTDASGVARFEVPAALDEGEGTQAFTISATVTDASAQAVADSTTVTVHPATWYAGIKPESYIAVAGEPETVHLVTVDVEGQVVPGRAVTVRVFEREWVRTKEQAASGGYGYRWEPRDTEIEVLPATTGDDAEASVTFTPPSAGTYRLVAESTDEQGRVARSARFLWVSGADHVSWRAPENDVIELIADRERYEVGDVAEVLVPAPFAGATALVTVERGRVLSSEVRTFATNSEVLRIAIEDKHIPNIYVGVVLYRAPTEDDPLPRYAIGYVGLPVATAPRRLEVRVEPDRDQAVPGETVRYEVTVTDADGAGVAADVAVAIVDEAVLSLAYDRGASGLEAFWYERPLGVQTASSLAVSVDRRNEPFQDSADGERGEGKATGDSDNDLADASESGFSADSGAALSQAVAAPAPASTGGDEGGGPAPRLRSNFQHTALWIGELTTDEDGTASFELVLPDNATTWRTRARAVTAATQVGEGDSELLVTQPLLVRPALPRFLRVGDDVTLRTLVRNGTADARDVTASIEVEGLTLDDDPARSARIEPGDSVVFEWPARALAEGTATVRFRADATGGHADAVEVSLPVHLDVTPETTATGGVVEQVPAVEAVYLPDYVITGSGSLEVSLQGSLVGALDQELAHFKPYRYESTIRVASRVVAIVAAQRATAGGLDAAWEHQLREDVQQLINRQTYVYDWGYGQAWGWCLRCSPDPLVTGWVLIALGEARDAGHDVPDDALSGATSVISSYLERQTDVERPADANQHAFLLFALTDAANHGREVSAAAREQAPSILGIAEEHRANLANWGRAYLLLGLLASGEDADHQTVRVLLNDLTADTIASANGNHWEDERIPGSMHNGSVRTTAIVLRALTEVDPQHPLIEETARWLALARSADRWKTTVERAQGMASLGAYAELTGETRGVYDYSVLVNTTEVLDGHFDVPAGDYLDAASVALADLPLGEVSRVQFNREADSPGRLYYGLNLRYVTPAAGIEALNRGFAISHRYSLLDDPETPITSAAPGDVVRVTVTVIAPADRLFARVEDFLPAGLEPIDPQLRIVSPYLREQLEEDRRDARQASATPYYAPWYRWYYSPWGQVDLRDDRLVLQASRLPQGVHEYVYYARATSPGDFFVAPAHAEETYFPEVFGRSDSSRFTIGDSE